MCGIFCSVQPTSICTDEYINTLGTSSLELLKHRGPDNQKYMYIDCFNGYSLILAHTRLQIVGDTTPQPIIDKNKEIILIINGEIFNWKYLEIELDYKCETSDCEILIPLYKKYIRRGNNYKEFFNKLNGQFSFVLYDSILNTIFVGRDHIGITPLYYGIDQSKSVFASELKCLNGLVSNIKNFSPRQYLNCPVSDIHVGNISLYMNYYDYENISRPIDGIKESIRDLLYNSVKLQMENIKDDVEYGFLLSGGLDSSIIISIVANLYPNKRLKTFSIGMNENSTDIVSARQVAKYFNTEHFEYYFSAKEGLEAIPNVIWYIESYDTTTVRASVPMYLLSKKIKEIYPHLKILFSGELSDEMFCYLYGGNAPTPQQFQLETVNLVSNVHMFDCLRANKTCMANGIEVRVPFTDKKLVDYIINIPVEYKTFDKINNFERMEKQLLRDAFKYDLPQNIITRKKEAYSDGVSAPYGNIKTNWIEAIKDYTEKMYTTYDFLYQREKYIYNCPGTKEELYYRQLFCTHFNETCYKNTSEFTVKFWKPKWCETTGYLDPSARKHLDDWFFQSGI